MGASGRDLYVGRLREALAGISALRTGTNVHSSDFRTWKGRTAQTLGQLFGHSHDYTRRFSNMHFCLPRVSLGPGTPVWAEEDQEVYDRDFHEAEQLLRDALEEVTPKRGRAVFDDILTDELTLVKANGDRLEGIRASVQKDMVFLLDEKLPVQEGDSFERTLPNGQVERLRIADVNFHRGLHGISGHFEIRVEKGTARGRGAPVQHVTNILHGDNARVNMGSVDQSVNVAGNVFSDVRQAFLKQVPAGSEREAILAKLTQLEKAKGTPSFVERYSEFMALAANHMTVLQPFVVALAQLLTR
jgi:hypothetical protein